MAEHNNTIYDFRDTFGIQKTTCMMSIRTKTDLVDIYIPYDWLSKNISDEDVFLWNKIGNETLFPASIEKVYFDYKKLENYDTRLNQFLGLKITCKKDYKCRQDDASENEYGIINRLTGTHTDLRTNCSLYSDGNFKSVKKNRSEWTGWANDHQLYETGECLQEYINRTINIQKEIDVDKLNCYKITIDCGNVLSYHHKLAILAFYRFLWSNLFDGLVYNTLRIIKEFDNIDPWNALYYVMSSKNYSSYYGLLYQPGFKPMSKVSESLTKGLSINGSFSAARKTNFTTIFAKDMNLAIDKFTGVESGSFKVVCSTDKLATLTKGKTYDAELSLMGDRYFQILKNDRWSSINVLKSHFEVI